MRLCTLYFTPHDLRSHTIDRAVDIEVSENAQDLYFGNSSRLRAKHYNRLLQGAFISASGRIRCMANSNSGPIIRVNKRNVISTILLILVILLAFSEELGLR